MPPSQRCPLLSHPALWAELSPPECGALGTNDGNVSAWALGVVRAGGFWKGHTGTVFWRWPKSFPPWKIQVDSSQASDCESSCLWTFGWDRVSPAGCPSSKLSDIFLSFYLLQPLPNCSGRRVLTPAPWHPVRLAEQVWDRQAQGNHGIFRPWLVETFSPGCDMFLITSVHSKGLNCLYLHRKKGLKSPKLPSRPSCPSFWHFWGERSPSGSPTLSLTPKSLKLITPHLKSFRSSSWHWDTVGSPLLVPKVLHYLGPAGSLFTVSTLTVIYRAGFVPLSFLAFALAGPSVRNVINAPVHSPSRLSLKDISSWKCFLPLLPQQPTPWDGAEALSQSSCIIWHGPLGLEMSVYLEMSSLSSPFQLWDP